MKLVIIILIAGLMQVSAASFGQKVSLSEKNATLSNIFQKMRAQTGYDFLFDAEVMRSTKRVNVNFKNVPLSEALKKCLEGQDLEFTIEAQSVIVRKKEKSFLDNVVARFQAIEVIRELRVWNGSGGTSLKTLCQCGGRSEQGDEGTGQYDCEDWMTKAAVMDWLCVSERTFSRRRAAGSWVMRKSGGRWYYLKSSILKK